MANLVPVDAFSDVYQLETTDLGLAGPGGIMNAQAQALANRTAWLAARLGSASYRNPLFVPDNVEHTLTTLLQGEAISLWEYLTDAQIAAVVGRTGAFDLTDEINTWLADCRGKTGIAPAGLYTHSGTLRHDPLYALQLRGAGWSSDSNNEGAVFLCTNPAVNGWEFVYSYAQWAPGGGADAHTAFDIANGNTPLGNSDNYVLIEGIKIVGSGAAGTPGSQSIQMFGVGPETQPTGCGVFLYWANHVEFRDCWVSGFPNLGYKGYWCFGSRVTRGYCVGNGFGGGALFNANNLFVLDNVKVIGNGMKSGPFISFGWLFGTEGAGKPANRGVQVLGNSDFEGQGFGALPGYGFEQSKGAITSITVSGGVATATLVGTISLAVGHYIGVVGGNAANSTTAINTVLPAIILTKVGQTITWATSAPDGTYTTGMKIFPYVVGLGLQDTYSCSVKGYTESTSGPAVYVYRGCRGVSIQAGEYIDGVVYVDALYYSSQYQIPVAGTGYTVGNILTAVGGTLIPGGLPLRIQVATVSSGGVVTFTVLDAGEYFSPPANNISFTGGTGTGFRLAANWYCDYPEGTKVANNAFLGAGGGLYSQTDQITTEGNAYNRSGADVPMYYVGALVKSLVPNLRETDALQVGGSAVPNHGVDQTISNRTPAHYSNWASGIGALVNLESSQSQVFARNNTAFGTLAGATTSKGHSNAFFGYRTGEGLANGARNAIFGEQDGGIASSNTTNFAALGWNSQGGAADNTIQIGNTSHVAARVQVAWTITSDSRLKTAVLDLTDALGIDYINALRPVSYRRINGESETRSDREMGLIAQEVAAATPTGYELVAEGPDGFFGVRYNDLLAPLVKAVQTLTARNAALEARIAALEP